MSAANHKDLVNYLKAVTPGAAKLPINTMDDLRAAVKAGTPYSGWRIHSSKWVVRSVMSGSSLMLALVMISNSNSSSNNKKCKGV